MGNPAFQPIRHRHEENKVRLLPATRPFDMLSKILRDTYWYQLPQSGYTKGWMHERYNYLLSELIWYSEIMDADVYWYKDNL